MTTRRCRGCGLFYDVKEKRCPDCGATPSAYNSGLMVGRLNRHLYDMAGSAQVEKDYARQHGL
jgi:hypothetical protein